MNRVLETTACGVDLVVDYTAEGPALPAGQPKLLYVHGLGCAQEDFMGAANDFGLRSMRKLSFTHPGCDNTAYPQDAALGIDHLVEVTHDVLWAEGLQSSSLILVGHSIGGAVAVRYAQKYPEDVVGLASVEGNLRGSDCFLTRKIMNGEETRDSLVKRFSGSGNPGFRRFTSRLLRTDPKALRDYAASAVEHSDRDDLFDVFASLEVPKIFICGDQNVDSIGYTGELAQRGVEIAVVSSSDHFPDADNPSEYFKIIGSFVDRVVSFTRGD